MLVFVIKPSFSSTDVVSLDNKQCLKRRTENLLLKFLNSFSSTNSKFPGEILPLDNRIGNLWLKILTDKN